MSFLRREGKRRPTIKLWEIPILARDRRMGIKNDCPCEQRAWQKAGTHCMFIINIQMKLFLVSIEKFSQFGLILSWLE